MRSCAQTESDCSGSQPFQHTGNTWFCFCLTCILRGGANLTQVYFSNLPFTAERCAFLMMHRKGDGMNLGIQPHNVHHPGSATEENQWGEASISLQRANAVSAETVCLGCCYSSHSTALVFKPSSYHAVALWSSVLVTHAQKPCLLEGERTAYPHFGVCVCSRLNEIAFTSVTLRCVTMSLGGENSCRKVKAWIISGKYYLQRWWIWCSSRLPGQFVPLFFCKEVNVTKMLPGGPSIERPLCADTHKDEIYYIATCGM